MKNMQVWFELPAINEQVVYWEHIVSAITGSAEEDDVKIAFIAM